MAPWHKSFVGLVKEKTGCDHQTAMSILAEVCEETQRAHMKAYNKGYKEGLTTIQAEGAE